MSRSRTTLLLAALLAACQGASEKPGAMLRGPGPMALFNGIVNHDGAPQKLYLAVGNLRGDELRLVDVGDDQVVASPGVAFPLSIPTPGRPMFVASASLHDGMPDALVVIASGTSTVEVVDTWSGQPTVLDTLATALPDGAQVLSITGANAPTSATNGSAKANVGRILVGLTGGRLAVLDFSREAAPSLVLAKPTLTILTGLGFDPVSLSQGSDARYVFAATHDAVNGVIAIALPGATTPGAVVAGTTNVPIKAVADVEFSAMAPDTATGTVERVIAVPLDSACGDTTVRCGLLALDVSYSPDTPFGLTGLSLVPSWIPGGKTVGTDETFLIPLSLPAPVTDLVAVGRPDVAPFAIAPGVNATTTALAVATATDGGTYLVDLAHWLPASSTDPLLGEGKTRVSAASSDAGPLTQSRIALWRLDKDLIRLGGSLSSKSADLVERARVHVTPGFTPDDDWTATWTAILPELDPQTTVSLAWDTSVPPKATLSVAVTVGGAAVTLGNLGVAVGDGLELSVEAAVDDTEQLKAFKACLSGKLSVLTKLDSPSLGSATFSTPCDLTYLAPPPPDPNPQNLEAFSAPAVAAFRALVLSGAKHGDAGHVPVGDTGDPLVVTGRRLFYVADKCETKPCADQWKDGTLYDLVFPFPTGVTKDATAPAAAATPALALALAAGFVDVSAKGVQTPATTAPPIGTSLHFTTRSGLTPAGRRPIQDGTALDSTMPDGLAIRRDQTTGGVDVFSAYTGGILMKFNTGAATDSMVLFR